MAGPRPVYHSAGQSSSLPPQFDPSDPIDPRFSTATIGRAIMNNQPVRPLAIRHQGAEIVDRPAPKVVYKNSQRTLPYFPHQHLDTAYFDEVNGAPICDCPGSGEGWDADGDISAETILDTDDDADAGFEAENNGEPKSTKAKTKSKARRKRKAKDAPQATEEQSNKRVKVSGGRPAVAKKVTADLDSDDELIVRMKEARYLEKDIAQALIDQGRTAYNPKTIGTRWRRLKQALAQRNDALLDADLTDWHEGDDDVLIKAIQKADKEIRRLTKDIEGKKWRMVADAMKNEKPVLNFSQNACQKRFEDLRNGKAKPTPESIENPTPEVVERIKARKARQLALDAQNPQDKLEMQNVKGNGWTSRMRTYY